MHTVIYSFHFILCPFIHMDEIVYKMILRLVLQNAFDISPVVVVNVFFFVGFVFFFSVKLRLTSHWFIFFLIFCLSILLLSHLSLLIFGFLENSPFSFRIMFFFICICYCFFFAVLATALSYIIIIIITIIILMYVSKWH